MTFVAGHRLRVTARFRHAGLIFAPRTVVATVTMVDWLGAPSIRTVTTANGIMHDRGAYYLDVTPERAGELIVVFQSAGAGEEGRAERRFTITAAHDLTVLEARPVDPGPASSDQTQRSYIIESLRDAGYDVDESRSDAYLDGMYRSHSTTDNARGRYLARQRRGR